MGTRFTRVTVVGTDRQIDISLPADAPVGEQLPTVLRLLSVPVSNPPHRWALSTPERGALDRARSLADAGILDGMVLYLQSGEQAAPPPFVDDVESAAAEVVAERAPRWADDARRSGVAGLLALVLLAVVAQGLVTPYPLSWLAPALAAVVALAVGALVRQRGGTWAALVAVPAALVAAVGAATSGLTGPTLMLAAAAGALGLIGAGLVRRLPGLWAAGLVVGVTALGAWLCLYLGLPADRTAALALVLAVIVTGLAGQLALGGAGLVNLLVADERGDRVPRAAVADAVRRGQAIATGLVWATAGTAAASCWVLLGSDGWVAPALGGLGGLLYAVRSRLFTRARQVAPMIGTAVVVAAGAAIRAPRWLAGADGSAPAWSALVLLAVLAVVIAALGFGHLSEVAGARVRRLLELAESVAMLALIPGVILLFDTIGAVRHLISS